MRGSGEAAAAMDALLAARELLLGATPLKGDCGRFCGAACCRPDAAGEGRAGGMYLFPGEENVYGPADAWLRIEPSGWIADGRDVPLLICQGACPRGERPLACRLFPLIARSRVQSNARSGRRGSADALEGFDLQFDPRGWPVCPLMPHGLRAMDPAFVASARAALATLWACPAHRGFLSALDALLGQYESF